MHESLALQLNAQCSRRRVEGEMGSNTISLDLEQVVGHPMNQTSSPRSIANQHHSNINNTFRVYVCMPNGIRPFSGKLPPRVTVVRQRQWFQSKLEQRLVAASLRHDEINLSFTAPKILVQC
jgi:hypothetical protein